LAGPKAQIRPTLFSFFLFFWVGIDPASPAWSLAQASDPTGKQARVAQPMRALHSAKVINLPSHCFLATIIQKHRGEEDFTW